MTRFHLTATLLLVSAVTVQADDTPAKLDVTPMLIQAAEEKYATEVAKAEAVVTKAETDLAKARKAAGETRLKAYKERLAEVTKTGDFDKALSVKARIEQLEKEPESDPVKPSKRPRPKDTVKFGGHTYALIKDPATWHVAKQRCEEMGGHLVCLETPKEAEFIAEMAGKMNCWIAATDEAEEGKWLWVTGAKVTIPSIVDNYRGVQNHMAWFGLNSRFEDFEGDCRYAFVCEWDQ